MNVEDLKLINLGGEMLLKLDVILFIITDRLVSKLFKFHLQCEENTALMTQKYKQNKQPK